MKLLALTLPSGNGQSMTLNPPAGLPTGGLNTVAKVAGNVFTIMLIIAVILALIFLILGGIGWITSGGDKQKVASARSRITFAIVGLIVALLSFFIVSVIGYVFKVNLLVIGS